MPSPHPHRRSTPLVLLLCGSVFLTGCITVDPGGADAPDVETVEVNHGDLDDELELPTLGTVGVAALERVKPPRSAGDPPRKRKSYPRQIVEAAAIEVYLAGAMILSFPAIYLIHAIANEEDEEGPEFRAFKRQMKRDAELNDWVKKRNAVRAAAALQNDSGED